MFKPIMDRILLRKVEEEQGGSVVIPDQYRESDKYEVVSLGDFVVISGERIPQTEFLRVGDLVLVSKYNVEACEFEGEKFSLARVQDVRGKQHVEARRRAA